MKKLNRHIKAGAITGLVFPVIALGFFVIEFRFYDWGIYIFPLIALIGGLLAGVGLGALIWQIEKWTSKRLWLILSILPALVVSMFITAILVGSD